MIEKHKNSGSANVKKVLLVAGVSGSGKSSFLSDLATGRLPDDILQLLPLGAAGWEQTNGNKLIRPRDVDGDPAGLTLHYDILRPFEHHACTHYADDRAIKIIERAEEITVVNLSPTRETLIRQLGQRISARGCPPILRPIVTIFGGSTSLPKPIHSFMSSAGGRKKQRHRRLLDLYDQENWLESWYSRWEKFVTEISSAKLRFPMVYVEPAPAVGPHRFTLSNETAAHREFCRVQRATWQNFPRQIF